MDVYTNYPQCISLISGSGSRLGIWVGCFAFVVAGICCGLLNWAILIADIKSCCACLRV